MSRLSFALAALLLSSTASAETPMEKARDVYQAGVAAFSAGAFRDAEQAFRDVYDLIHSPEVLYDIALTLEKQRKWGPSADVYEAYVRDSKKVKDRARIIARIAELRGRAKRQEELDAALNSGVSPQEVAQTPGNEMMKLGDTEDSLLAFGEASGEDDAAKKRAADAAPSDSGGTPIYKKWWLWAAVGAVVVVAVVVGVAVAASSGGAPEMTTFPDIGPGSKAGALLRF